jgi:hypothetical protein
MMKITIVKMRSRKTAALEKALRRRKTRRER